MISPNFNFLGEFDVAPLAPNQGDVYYDTTEEKLWLCNGDEWILYPKIEDGQINTGITMYDINKQLIEKLPSKITNGQLKECKEILKLLEKQGTYFMLLCNDIHYYTVITKTDDNMQQTFYNTVIELLQDNGVIQDILWSNDDHEAVECWIKNENGVFMFMLFPYDWGIVKCQ